MRKILYGALGLVIIGVIGVIILINTSGAEAFTFSSVDVHETKEVSAEGISNLRIDSPSVDVYVEPTSGDQIEVDFSGKVGKKSKDLYTLDIDQDGDTVKISMDKKDKFQFMMFNFTKVSLTVKVPERVYHSIEINAASGDIAVNDMKAKEFAIETKSGDIVISNAVAEDTLDLNASSGDIVTKDIRSNEMKMETSSGDITSYNQVLEDTKMETSSGDIIVKAKELKGNVSLEASSGDIDVRFAGPVTSMKVDYKSSSGDGSADIDEMSFSEKSENRIVGQTGDGSYKVKVRTSSGDFKIKD